MKEIPIGEEIRIRCVEDVDSVMCWKCFFSDIGCTRARCNRLDRTDRKSVHFELVETTEPSAPTRLTTNQKIDIVNQFYTCQDKRVAKRTIEMVEEMLNQKEKDNESK